MKTIAELPGHVLKWGQPHMLKMEYELHADEQLAATLHFRSSWGSFATAQSGDGCWTFKRVGFWTPRVTIRRCDEEVDLAIFKNNTWSGGGTLELTDGRKFLATTNFWQTQMDFKTESGDGLLLRFRNGGFFRPAATLELGEHPELLAKVPWLPMLGWYLIVMMNNDSAAAVAAGS